MSLSLEEDRNLVSRADPVMLKLVACGRLWVLWFVGSEGIFAIASLASFYVVAVVFIQRFDGQRWVWNDRRMHFEWQPKDKDKAERKGLEV